MMSEIETLDTCTQEHPEPVDRLTPHYREEELQPEGAAPVPAFVWITIIGTIVVGFFYLGLYVGDFSPYPWLQQPDSTVVQPAAAAADDEVDGAEVYSARCASCHQLDGTGMAGAFPPLAGSTWVTGDAGRLVRIILNGLSGPVEVDGEVFNSFMPGWGTILSDAEIAAVATFVRSEWGNDASPVTPEMAAAVRSVTRSNTAWTVADLEQPDNQGIPGSTPAE